MVARSWPDPIVAGPAIGQGRTTVVAALARLRTWQGRMVRVFKRGPDLPEARIHGSARDTTFCSLCPANPDRLVKVGADLTCFSPGKGAALRQLAHAKRSDDRAGEPVYRLTQTTASYVHLCFPANPEAAARLFPA